MIPSTYMPTVDLPANTTLYWRVQTRGANGPSAWSVARSFHTGNPPSIPLLVLPANNALTTDYTPRLDWSLVTLPVGVTFGHYQVQVANNAAFTAPVVDEFGLTDRLVHEYTPVTDLTSNTTYYWRVRSYNTAGEYSAWSLVRKFRTALVSPALLLPADGENQPNKRPSFVWGDVAGVTGYSIQISRNLGFTQLVGTYPVVPSTYTPTADLPANMILYWRVQSRGANGPSVWSGARSFHTANPPSTPTLLLPANNALTTDYTPRLDWGLVTLPVGVTFGHYQVQVADNAAFTAPVVDESGLTDRLVHEYTPVTDLTPNTKYYWRVRAYNLAGEYSAWSLVRTFRTAFAAPVLSTPGNGGITTLLRPPLDWLDVPGATSYTIQVSKNNSFTQLVVNKNTVGAVSIYTPLVNLPANVTLYWRVRANGVNGPSLWSSPVWSFTVVP
jgi:chitodextrinase